MAKETTKTTNKKVPSGRRKTAQGKTSKPSAGGSTCLAPAPELNHEQIVERAKKIWQNRGCVPGFDDQNWHEAERQLKAELGLH